MANVEENPQTPLRLSVQPITIPIDEAAAEFSQASSSHPFETEASPPSPPKKPLTPKELILSEAANISSQPLHTSDTAAWGALTALSVIARNRPQGVNMLLTSDEHCIGRGVDDMRFQIESNAVSAHHCKIFRKRVTAEDAENPSASSTTVFLKDTSTNGTYLNWEKLKKTSSDAKLRHGDIISFAAPPQHELAVAYVFREGSRFNSLNDSACLKRKAEGLGSKTKRLKGTGIDASESPIPRYELRSRQQSNMISKEPMKRLEGQVLTADSVCIENHEAVAHHGSDDASTQGSKANSECVVDYSTEFTTQEIFKSREALIQWAREVGRRNGFVVVIKTSDAGEKPRITFGCERSGSYRDSRKSKKVNGEKRLKMVGTKKCGCPFALKDQKLATDDDWTVYVQCGMHNHPAVELLEGHSYAGRLSEEETSLLVDMSKSLVRPKEILVTLKQRDVLNVTTMKTIYNARHRYRVAEKARTSQLQQLLGQLTVHKYIEWHRSCESTGAVTDFLWAHPFSLELFRAFPRVLLLDSSYKTNRYRLPLVEIVGVTSTDMTFSVAFAYLQYEREENYAWVLGVLRSVMDGTAPPDVIVTDREMALLKAILNVFPSTRHLLCRWHINKHVVAKCRIFFETEERWDKFINSWNMLILSSTEGEYITKLAAFNKDFTTYPEALEYVTNNWLDTCKDKFVAAWTDTCMHCGNVTINRAEGSHAKLKRQLGSSQGSFESSWRRIHNLLELQHSGIKSSFEKSLIVEHDDKPFELNELWGNISISALDRVLAETKRANFVGCDASACGCIIRLTHGLPCAHEISDFMKEGRPIPLDALHPHWRNLDMSNMAIDCKPELDLVAKLFKECDSSAKVEILKKLRDLVSSNYTSTHRDPCAFELVPSSQDSYTGITAETTVASMEQIPRRRLKEKVHRTRTLEPISYIDALPAGLRPYIRHVKDVASDGNCGFKAIAELMGFGEDGWLQVRTDLLTELNSHADHYKQLFGTQERVDGLVYTLSYFEGCPGHDRWMIMPDMGHLISSCYNVVLFHLSSKQCLTFLPLRSSPLPTVSRKEISICCINDSHFIEVFLLPGHPIPPIATNWHQYHCPCAQGWDTVYNSRIQQFREIFSSDVVTREATEMG